MKRLFKLFYLVAIVNVLFVTSCKHFPGDDPLAKPEFEILTEYLVASDMDLDHVIKSAAGNKFVTAPAAIEDLAGKYVIDIRSGESFAAGHIEGSVNTTIGNLLNEAANAGDKPIVVACYSGQTACFATALLRLYGYTEAQALKWGMSSWNQTTDTWTGKTGDSGEGQLSTSAAPENIQYPAPVLSTGMSDGESILKARVEAVIQEWGNAKVSSAEVVASPEDYFVNNFFSADHYVGFGHVEGAVRVNPLTIANGGTNFLDSSKPVVTYCYTGQTSAVITAFLRVLGYDAKSMLFGMNGLNHSNTFWSTGGDGGTPIPNHWGVNANPKDFPLIQ